MNKLTRRNRKNKNKKTKKYFGGTIDANSVEPSPSPVEPSHNPVEPTPSPVEPTPSPNPVEPTPTPVEPTPNPNPNPVEPTPNPNPVEPTPSHNPVEPTDANPNPTISQLKKIGAETNADPTITKMQDSGIIGVIADKLTEPLFDLSKYAQKQGLKLIGLKPINSSSNNSHHIRSDGSVETETEPVSGVQKIGSNIVNIVNKGTTSLIGQVNEVLDTPKTETSVTEAATEAVKKGEKLLNTLNIILSTPEMKKQTAKAVDNVVSYIKLGEPIIDKAVDELNDVSADVLSGIASGVTKSVSDALESVPIVGVALGILNVANDASKSIANTVKGVTDATKIGADVADNLKNLYFDVQEGLSTQPTEYVTQQGGKQLIDNMKAGTKILNRTNKSIDIFTNPLNYSKNKTKNKLLKYPAKTKKVRFLI